MEVIRQVLSAEIRNAEDRTLTCFIVTGRINRGRRKIDLQGGQFGDYYKSPVLLAFHDETKVIGRCIWLRVEEEGILAKFEFNHTPIAEDILSLYKEGCLTSWSIGFLPVSYKWEEEEGQEILHITKWTLLEVSAVSIPMDADAITVAIGQGMVHDTALLQSLNNGFRENNPPLSMQELQQQVCDLRELMRFHLNETEYLRSLADDFETRLSEALSIASRGEKSVESFLQDFRARSLSSFESLQKEVEINTGNYFKKLLGRPIS